MEYEYDAFCAFGLGYDSNVFRLIGSLVGLAITEWNTNLGYEIWAWMIKLYTLIDGIDAEQDREFHVNQTRVQVQFDQCVHFVWYGLGGSMRTFRMVRLGGSFRLIIYSIWH